jgi:hypothetical protein
MISEGALEESFKLPIPPTIGFAITPPSPDIFIPLDDFFEEDFELVVVLKLLKSYAILFFLL